MPRARIHLADLYRRSRHCRSRYSNTWPHVHPACSGPGLVPRGYRLPGSPPGHTFSGLCPRAGRCAAVCRASAGPSTCAAVPPALPHGRRWPTGCSSVKSAVLTSRSAQPACILARVNKRAVMEAYIAPVVPSRGGLEGSCRTVIAGPQAPPFSQGRGRHSRRGGMWRYGSDPATMGAAQLQPFSSVLHGESFKRLAPPRNTKDRKHLQSAQRSTTGTTQRPSTRHYRKGSPGVKTHNTNQHSSRARLQHSNRPPSLPTPNRVTTRSSQPTQPAAKHRRAEQHYNTDTTRLSGDTPPSHQCCQCSCGTEIRMSCH